MGPPGGEVHLSSPAPEVVVHHSGDESQATVFSLVSSIIHSCHPGPGVALGSGRNYSQGPALRRFYPQLSLTTSNFLL